MTLREEITKLSGIIREEDSDEYIDDYEELPMPDGLEINRENGTVAWNGKRIGVTPLRGTVTFIYNKDCPKEALKYFRDSRYVLKKEEA